MKPIHCILLERVQRQDNGNEFEINSEYAELNWLSFCGIQVRDLDRSLELCTKIPARTVVSRIKVRETRGEVAPGDE